MIEYIIVAIIFIFFAWRWEVLQGRIIKLERQSGDLFELRRMEKLARINLEDRVKTLSTVLRNVRNNQIEQRKRTPSPRPTIRNRELMQLGRDIQAGKVDQAIKKELPSSND